MFAEICCQTVPSEREGYSGSACKWKPKASYVKKGADCRPAYKSRRVINATERLKDTLDHRCFSSQNPLTAFAETQQKSVAVMSITQQGFIVSCSDIVLRYC